LQSLAAAVRDGWDSLPKKEKENPKNIPQSEEKMENQEITNLDNDNTVCQHLMKPLTGEAPMSTVVRLDRYSVKSLLVALGWLQAQKWDDTKALSHLVTFRDHMDDDEEFRGRQEKLPEFQKTLFRAIIAGIAADDEFELTSEETRPMKIKGQKKDKEPTKKRVKIFGQFSVTSICHWMGMERWDLETAVKVLEKLGVSVHKDSVRTCLSNGNNPKFSKAAVLSQDQQKELADMAA
jgi:hypothetical protein